jgi:flagella basal body P-ring formation protein FlgA
MKISRKMEEGTVLTNQMYDLVPDVKRGDLVSISLKGETFEITLPGKARQNGLIGEEVFVLVGATGKRLKGTIDSPNHIIIGK